MARDTDSMSSRILSSSACAMISFDGGEFFHKTFSGVILTIWLRTAIKYFCSDKIVSQFCKCHLNAGSGASMLKYRGRHDERIIFEIFAVGHFSVATFATCIEVTRKAIESVGPVVLYEGGFRPTATFLAPEVGWAHVGGPNPQQFPTIVTGQAGARHLGEHISVLLALDGTIAAVPRFFLDPLAGRDFLVAKVANDNV